MSGAPVGFLFKFEFDLGKKKILGSDSAADEVRVCLPSTVIGLVLSQQGFPAPGHGYSDFKVRIGPPFIAPSLLAECGPGL